MADSTLLDFDVYLVKRTMRAILVNQEDPFGKDSVWLPRSQVEIDPQALPSRHDTITIAVPEWLALEKGMI